MKSQKAPNEGRLSGNYTPGYQTPASAYGADLVLEIEGTARQDIA